MDELEQMIALAKRHGLQSLSVTKAGDVSMTFFTPVPQQQLKDLDAIVANQTRLALEQNPEATPDELFYSSEP